MKAGIFLSILIAGSPRAVWAAEMTPRQQRVQRTVLEREKDFDLAYEEYNSAYEGKTDAYSNLVDMRESVDVNGWRPGLFMDKFINLPKKKHKYNEAKEEYAGADQGFFDAADAYVKAEKEYRAAFGENHNPDKLGQARGRVAQGAPGSSASESDPKDRGKNPKPQDALEEAKNLQRFVIKPGGGAKEAFQSVDKLAKLTDGLADTALNALDPAAMAASGASSAGPAEDEGAAPGRGLLAKLPPGTGVAPRGAPPRGRPGRDLPPDAMSSDTLINKRILLSETKSAGAKSRTRGTVSWGNERFEMRDYGGALRAADLHIQKYPDDPRGYLLKAKALNKLRRFAEAEEAAQRAVDLDKDNLEAYRALVWAQLHTGKYTEAAANAGTLIRLDPGNAEAYLLRAFAYEKMGLRDKMLADLQMAVELDPARYSGHLALAKSGATLFDPTRADSEILLDAISLLPGRRPSSLILIGFLIFAVSIGNLILIKFRGPAPEAGGAAALRSLIPTPRARAAADGKLGGKYRLGRVAGKGGMGKVWSAVDATLDRKVAIKQMAAIERADDAKLKEMFLAEARTVARLRHPSIVDIYEIIDDASGLFLVFEWVSGKTLQQLLAEKKRLPLAEVARIMKPVCEALAFAHGRGIIHRDLKPANIMITDEGAIKVMDFGIARALAEEPARPGGADAPPCRDSWGLRDARPGGADAPPCRDSWGLRDARPGGDLPASGGRGVVFKAARTRTLAGTPAYSPPEAREGLISPAADVFGLGATVYELLSGRLPFGPEGRTKKSSGGFVPLSHLDLGLGRDADGLMARTLADDPASRLASAAEFLGALDALLRPGVP